MKASEEKEAAAHALEKADNDPQSTKAKIDKVIAHFFIESLFKLWPICFY